jgi:hypothetical protein
MANSALYVKLDQESFERLRRLSAEERRQPGDQAALLLQKLLLATSEADPRDQRETVAA